MKKIVVFALFVFGMAAANSASADNVRGINIDFVTISNAGNTGDTRAETYPSGCGAVGYNYRIGKYEVTNAQWNAFTDVAGAPTGDQSYAYDQSALFIGAQQPTNMVSWYETLQFCNYLTSGDKSKGVYQFSGNNSNPGDFLGINRAAAQAAYGTIYFLPTEDEWYKAAYYKPDGSGYSTYANGEESIPAADNGWNYDGGSYSEPWNVGTGTMEQNGTFDMMGNVWEWNESLLVANTYFLTGFYRVLRGGCYLNTDGVLGSPVSSYYSHWQFNDEGSHIGFRVASVPEPTIDALVDINPDSINKNSKGQWVTVYITLPAGYDVAKIDASTIAITSLTGTSCQPDYHQALDLSFTPQVGDRDEDGIPDLTVKFNRQELIANLCLDDVAVTVEGKLFTGEHFKGIDHIRVIDRGK